MRAAAAEAVAGGRGGAPGVWHPRCAGRGGGKGEGRSGAVLDAWHCVGWSASLLASLVVQLGAKSTHTHLTTTPVAPGVCLPPCLSRSSSGASGRAACCWASWPASASGPSASSPSPSCSRHATALRTPLLPLLPGTSPACLVNDCCSNSGLRCRALCAATLVLPHALSLTLPGRTRMRVPAWRSCWPRAGARPLWLPRCWLCCPWRPSW